MQIDIATRHYIEFCPVTQKEYPVIDRMVRRGRQFFLIESPARPGEAEVERRYTRKHVFEWFREMPEQIDRVVR